MDRREAVRLFRLAVDQQLPDACCNLGWCHLDGKGVELDVRKAAELFQSGVDRGNPSSTLQLGKLHRSGTGVDSDPVRAFDLFTRAATEGSGWVAGEAQLALGEACEKGHVVSRGRKKAREWYERARERGIRAAETRLESLETTEPE